MPDIEPPPPKERPIKHAYCYRSGKIEFGAALPEGTRPLGKARSARKLREIVTVNARHHYDGTTLLVPGAPEADTEDDAIAAYCYFRDVVSMRLAGQSGWPARQGSQPAS
ncbi:hypothetical protein [Gluconobacter kondonii]|uniref:Host nuclease inhibitor protein n=2 Tax=Gluconobacter kondonii TaxID=941463 RepID=A0ABQ5WWC9_9PROT|nr:hypothetical protein [Gluconobacter kondonii]GBR36675.1 hypothetical protein AA3266_2441 [Gluconobacter kondonii NBRC 3266]GLQ67375.1 hypothetical protein GCM10007870_29600 [Gluconobacter kondonii]